MTTISLTEAIRFSPTDYPSILTDTKLRVGYEIEFIPKFDSTKYSNSDIQQQIASEIESIGIPVVLAQMASRKKWALTVDGSVKSQDKNILGLELISPPMPVAIALEQLEKVFNWMRENQHVTNYTTGFHVGVSYGGKKMTQRADPLKLVLLLGEHYLLQAFQREANEFTQSHLDSLKDTISSGISSGAWNQDPDIQHLKKRVMQYLKHNKYYTVNLTKQAEKGYFEFRIMGNDKYHLKFQQVQDTILRYCFVLKASIDPESWEKEYLHELGNLILQAISSVTTPVLSDRVIRYAVIASGSPQQDAVDLAQCQENFDSGNIKAAFSLLGRVIYHSVKNRDNTPSQQKKASVLAYQVILHRNKYKVNDLLQSLRRDTPEAKRMVRLIREYLGE